MAIPKRRGRKDLVRDVDEEKKFQQRILELARVTRVVKGGKRMRFRACVAIGDAGAHRVGLGIAKGADVAQAIAKATTQAEKNLHTIPLIRETIPHLLWTKYGAARLMIKPAPKGTGVKAGGVMRILCELGGVPNIVGKMMGSKNKLNNAQAILQAFDELKRPVVTTRATIVEQPQQAIE
ncbi:30S ribosomal protein S5 [Candidatus Uhrbacteria bacterium]|nr:30S ribosomal protein S5 [Candidatus Uhrbacteria bacterium]